jgi:hypothetical protein
MRRVGWQDRARYAFDNLMAKGTLALVGLLEADDFVVSTKLISLYLTQLSESGQLAEVFAALFGPRRAEIHLKSAADYVRPGQTVDFATLIEAAGRRGETAIGYRRQDEVRRPPQYGVTLNPDKSALLTLGPRTRSSCWSTPESSPLGRAGHACPSERPRATPTDGGRRCQDDQCCFSVERGSSAPPAPPGRSRSAWRCSC